MSHEPYRMVIVRINDWDEFYVLASWFLNDVGQWVFRGQKKVEWELATTLERESKKQKSTRKGKSQFVTLDEYLRSRPHSNEVEQIETFKALTQWDHYMGEHKLPYLAAMQHYGFPLISLLRTNGQGGIGLFGLSDSIQFGITLRQCSAYPMILMTTRLSSACKV